MILVFSNNILLARVLGLYETNCGSSIMNDISFSGKTEIYSSVCQVCPPKGTDSSELSSLNLDPSSLNLLVIIDLLVVHPL